MSEEVSEQYLRESIQHLTSRPTRYALSSHYTEAARWAFRKLSGWCWSCDFQPFPVGNDSCMNVLANRGAAAASIIVVAHLDSIGGSGADDNASGCAGLLELARLLSFTEESRCIRFVLTGAEEIGGEGGQHYIASLPPEHRAAIKAVINIDQIGRRRTPELTVKLETKPEYEWLANVLEAAALAHTDLRVEKCFEPWGGDHITFLKAGIPAVLTIQGEDEQIHSPEDREEFIDYGLVAEITRMNLAAILKLSRGKP